jgi:hypothetical protein
MNNTQVQVEQNTLVSFSNSLRGKIADFFFARSDAAPLGFFRIAIAMVGLAQVVSLWPYMHQFYGNFGLIQWAVIETAPDTWLPSVGKLSLLAAPLDISADTVLTIVFGAYAVSLIGLALGWKTRVWSIATLLLHTLTVNSGYISLYGVDTLLHVCLFYCAWMPVGASASIDVLRSHKPIERTWQATLSLRVLQLHLCILYINTGFAKASGSQWWTGEALWRALIQPQFATFDLAWLAQYPWILQAAGVAVVMLQVGYAFFIWPRITRPYWCAATLALHAGIFIFMGLWMFALTMIVLNFTAFGYRLLQPSAE